MEFVQTTHLEAHLCHLSFFQWLKQCIQAKFFFQPKPNRDGHTHPASGAGSSSGCPHESRVPGSAEAAAEGVRHTALHRQASRRPREPAQPQTAPAPRARPSPAALPPSGCPQTRPATPRSPASSRRVRLPQAPRDDVKDNVARPPRSAPPPRGGRNCSGACAGGAGP